MTQRILANKNLILAQHPWILDHSRNLVVGTDLDALLTAFAFLEAAHRVGESPRIIGFYDLQDPTTANLYASAGIQMRDLLEARWVDLDMTLGGVRSLGQHMLLSAGIKRSELPSNLKNLANPNLHTLDASNCLVSSLSAKYPFGSVHWAMWLLGLNADINPLSQSLFLLADSSGTNFHTYKDNAKAWLDAFGKDFILNHVDFKDDLETYLKTILETENLLRFHGKFTKGNQNPSQNIPLAIDVDSTHHLNSFATWVRGSFGWSKQTLRSPFSTGFLLRSYKRSSLDISSAPHTMMAQIDAALSGNRLISYAIPRSRYVNYAYQEISAA